MQPVTTAQVIHTLRSLGLQAGDGVLVHSAVQYLGKPENGVGTYYTALAEVLDLVRGTLAVPAFNFAFARGEPYNPLTTPSQGMGVFSEYVRQRVEARRTPHPMQSIAVVGASAPDLAGRDTPSAFDPGSAFERMLTLDFKLLLLGADVQAVSMVHYSEQRACVPYRYWKEFSGEVYEPARGRWEMRTYRMYVRDMEIDPQLKLLPIQRVLEERQQWLRKQLNYGYVCTCRLRDFVAAADELLAQDAWAFVAGTKTGTKKG